jgi:hypothetical protein
MVKRVDGAAAARDSVWARKVAELESSLMTLRQEISRLRTVASSEESRALALEGQLEGAHRTALTEVESERTRLHV